MPAGGTVSSKLIDPQEIQRLESEKKENVSKIQQMHNEMRELRRTLEDFEANKSQELSNLQSSLTKELCSLYRYDTQLFGSFHHIT